MARRIKERWKKLLAEYGRIAIITYFSLFILTMLSFTLAISWGLDLGDWTGGKAGTIAAAYVATQVTKPARFIATLAMTPFIARLIRRKPLSQVESSDSDEEE